MKYLIGLLCLFSVAQAQFAPTSAKTKFVNGIGIGSKDTSQFTAADTIALTIARDSVMYYRYRGFWRPIATGGNLSAYKLISDTLFNNGYTTRARLKQGLDSLAATKGTVNSVGLTMPSAFNVANSPITTSGTLAVTAAGNATQYIRGDGALATLPTSGSGGGASVSYYLNGSVNQGTIGGVTYYEMNETPIIGAGTDFTINANGYVASFLTDANDPALLKIPAGNWNFETYFSASSGGGSPTFYIELYKYDGTTFTLIASNSGSPKLISDGTNIEAYFSALAVPETVLTLTDRLAVRIYVSHSGRTITLHTENGDLCQVITTFTTGLTALNGLTAQVQYFATGTSGTDFNIASATATHTFNLPTASATNRGALSSANWTTFNNKIGAGDTAAMLLPYLRKTDTATMLSPYYRTATATAALATKLNISDTAAMLSNYRRTSTKITNSDLANSTISGVSLGGNLLSHSNGYGISGSAYNGSAAQTWLVDTANISTKANVVALLLGKQNNITLTTTGTSGAATLTGATLNIPQYQAALTNPVTGTGTTNYLPKFTGSTTVGNSNLINDASGNLGLGVTPSAWVSTSKGFQIGSNGWASISQQHNGATNIMSNSYESSSNAFTYIASAYALRYNQNLNNGSHAWFNAPSGTAGNAITFTQAMTLDASGRLGIGTTSPAGLLQLQSTTPTLYITGVSDNSAIREQAIYFGASNTATAGFIKYQSWSLDNYMAIATNGSERMRITSGGNLLVGTTTDNGARLQVSGGGTFSDGNIFITNSTASSSTQREFFNYINPSGSVASSNGVSFGFRKNNTFPNRGASIKLSQEGTSDGSGDANTNIGFWTYSLGNDNGAERMRITSGGNVGIGTTSPAYKLDVNGTLGVTGAATFSSSVTATSYQVGTLGKIDISGTNLRNQYYDGFAWNDYLSINTSTGLVSTPQNVTLTGSASLTTSNIIGANIGLGKNYISSFNDASIDMSRNGLTNSNILSFTTVSNSDSWQMGVLGSAGSTREFSIRSGTSGKVLAIDYLTGAATFSSSVTATSFFESSDSRLKNIIKRDGDVAYFKWKNGQDNKTHIGYIAQEVQKANPDQVKADDKGMLSVNYIEILVQKVRDLEKEIAELKKHIK